jgi:hypothetical protein
MRNGQNQNQNKRMRGRNRKSHHHHNPLARVYESNGPDVKIRGNAAHVAEKYMQLARDAHSSGDPVAAENYFQHAEHYFRMIAAAQEQFRQSQPLQQQQGQQGQAPMQGAADTQDDDFDDDDMEPMGQPMSGGGEQQPFGVGEPQPSLPRDAQFFPPRGESQGYSGRPQHRQQPQQPQGDNDGNIDRLPSFITGGQQHAQSNPQGQQGHSQNNGYDNNQGGDRFNRRRRRHRGPRPDAAGGQQGMSGDTSGEPSPTDPHSGDRE